MILLCHPQLWPEVIVIPPFEVSGLLPPGIHSASWSEMAGRFSFNRHREWLTDGLQRATTALRVAGCQRVFIDGSFVTTKDLPGDYDLCWSTIGVNYLLLDPVLLDFSNRRQAMKAKYRGDLFLAETVEGVSGRTFLNFFQIDKATGGSKGIVRLDLWSLP